MKDLATLLLLAAAASVHADPLLELRHTLASMRGTAPIAVSFEERQVNKSQGRFFTQNLNRHSVAEVKASADGVSVTLSRAMLDRLRAQRSVPRNDQSGIETAGDVKPAYVAELLDFAPTLQAMLSQAVLSGSRDTQLGGSPARLLLLKIPPERNPSKDIHVESAGDDLSIWLGRDGFPLAAERRGQISAGFLFLKASGTSTDKWTFARRDDRLVVLHHERSSSGGGMGQKSEATEVENITIR